MNRHRNQNQERGRANHNVAAAGEADLDIWRREMRRNLETKPTLLSETSGNENCCIFRVPQSLVEINEKAYQPRTVSIGPYHHGAEHLKMIEQHKWRFLQSLLERKPENISLINDCFQAIALWETGIRECYSETNKFSSQEFVQMMVLDGCFIIELVYQVSGMVRTRIPNDPIFRMEWVLPFLMRDLLKLENQIPLFVLESLFETLVPDPVSLSSLILKFFSDHVLERPPSVVSRARDFVNAKHVLDLVRHSFSPASPRERQIEDSGTEFLRSIQPAEKLHRAGIQFKTRSNKDSFLDIKFSNGVLRIPRLTMDDSLSSFILNSVAFEQCYGHDCKKFMTDYATFMGCLIHTPTDAGFLSDHKIVENCFGTDEEVACFFANVGKDVAFDIRSSYLSNLIEEVNKYYWNDWNVRWASFKYKYFGTPWSFISALAASILLLLTMIQTLLTWLGYVHPHD